MATTQRPTVVGVFDNRADAEKAVEELHRAGFRDDQIGFAARGGETAEGTTEWQTAGPGEAGEGAAKGAVSGGIIGAILGALATGLIPGIGPVIAGGLLAGIIGGAAAGAAGGGLLGALVGSMGVPEEEARYYDEEFRAGRTLVTVKADGRYDEARSLLRRHGARDVEDRGAAVGTGATAARPGAAAAMNREETMPTTWDEAMPTYRQRWQQRYGTSGGRWEEVEPAYRYGWEMRSDPRYRDRRWAEVEPELRRDWEARHRDRPWDRVAGAIRDAWEGATAGARTAGEDTVRLREEELQARKEPVQTGEARIGKEVVTEEKTMEVPVTREEVVVERRPVERKPSDRPIGEGEGETVEVPVREERVEVEKEPVVYEEVEVGKRPVRETEQVSGTVRREEARVEREGDVDVRGDEGPSREGPRR